MDGILRLIGQNHALLIFGVSGTIMLLFGVERGVWVVNTFRETHILGTGSAILCVLLSIMGAMTLFTGIILYSVRSFVLDAVQRRERAPDGRPHVIGKYWPLVFFSLLGILLLVGGEGAGLRVIQLNRERGGIAVGTALVCALLTTLGTLSILTGFTLQSIRGLLSDTLGGARQEEAEIPLPDWAQDEARG